MLDRASCLDADRHDPLAPFRQEFLLPGGVIYLDGNSLGPMPRTAEARATKVLREEWGDGLVRSWNSAGWFQLPVRLGDLLARILGAAPGEVVLTDTISVNLFKVLAAALEIQAQDHPGRKVLLAEGDAFPTDLYMAQGLARLLDRGWQLRLTGPDRPLERALDADVAVALLSHVNYRTGAMLDLAAVTARIHAQGALAVWDLAHSAGAVPIDLEASGADFAVGCTYKYLNAGPGAPGFLWVPKRLQPRFRQPLSGWWGHQDPFAMQPGFRPAPDIRAGLCGTQPVLSLAVAEGGLELAARADMALVRSKSLALADLFIKLAERRCAGHPLTLVTPREHARRGSHVSFRHPEGYAVMQALIARGVIGDYREPEVLRFGITPLYLGFADVWDAVEILGEVLDTRAWDRPEHRRRGLVT